MQGPQSPSVLSNMIHMSEFQADWIVHLCQHMQVNGLETVDCKLEEEEAWTKHCVEVALTKVQSQCNNW